MRVQKTFYLWQAMLKSRQTEGQVSDRFSQQVYFRAWEEEQIVTNFIVQMYSQQTSITKQVL